jgi:hypothetical protein
MSDKMRKRLRVVEVWSALGALPVAGYIIGLLLVQSVQADTGAATAGNITISGNTLLPIGLVIVLLGVVWRASSAFRGLEDSIGQLKHQLENHKCNSCANYKK